MFLIYNENKWIKNIKNHISCKCKCKFDSRKYNSKQKWNNHKCQCECKYLRKYVCEKYYILNPSICTCKKDKYSGSIIRNSEIKGGSF